VLLVVCTPAWAQAPADDAERNAQSDAARAARAAELTRKAAEDYTIRREGETTPLKLSPRSLLQWSNPVAGSIHGSVFVWTKNGRPEAVASIYKFSSPLHHLGVEFHSLASVPLTAERDGTTAWSPARPGLEFKPVAGAPRPDAAPARRLRQMRALAQDFTATETTRGSEKTTGERITRKLRLLTQPVLRYENPDPDILDGGLFTFVEGTDTEIFLLIEARRAGDGFRWEFALARMNSIEMHVSHNGKEVWQKDELPWAVVANRREPYTLFTFQPGEGANPPGEPRDPFAN
jgi:hypothetical protein